MTLTEKGRLRGSGYQHMGAVAGDCVYQICKRQILYLLWTPVVMSVVERKGGVLGEQLEIATKKCPGWGVACGGGLAEGFAAKTETLFPASVKQVSRHQAD